MITMIPLHASTDVVLLKTLLQTDLCRLGKLGSHDPVQRKRSCSVHDGWSSDKVVSFFLHQRTSETIDKAALLIKYLKLIKLTTLVSF